MLDFIDYNLYQSSFLLVYHVMLTIVGTLKFLGDYENDQNQNETKAMPKP